MYTVIELRPCIILDINPSKGNASINYQLVEYTFLAARPANLVSVSKCVIYHY